MDFTDQYNCPLSGNPNNLTFVYFIHSFSDNKMERIDAGNEKKLSLLYYYITKLVFFKLFHLKQSNRNVLEFLCSIPKRFYLAKTIIVKECLKVIE